MENPMFISMLGSAAVSGSQERSEKKTETNSSAFTQCLNKATDTEATEKELISEKETAKQAAERQKNEKADAQAQARAAQAKLAQNPKAMGGKAFLYDMMYRNPDTLNMAERQALKLDNAMKETNTQATNAPTQNDMAARSENNAAKTVTQADSQSFKEMIGKEKGKVKDDSGKVQIQANESETNQVGSAKSEGVNAEAKTEEVNKTQQLSQTQKRQQVIDQIVTHMEIRNFADRDELQLRLNPEYLGDLKIKLTKGEDGELTAQFITTSEDTREVLTDSRAELRSHIEKKGLLLKRIEIEKVDDIA